MPPDSEKAALNRAAFSINSPPHHSIGSIAREVPARKFLQWQLFLPLKAAPWDA